MGKIISGQSLISRRTLQDPRNVEQIKSIYTRIILKRFTERQALFGARVIAINLCKASNNCKGECDFCITEGDIKIIIKS